MNSYIKHLIAEYKNKDIIVDTNLLILLLVGRYNIDFINKFKRTQAFSKDDYYLLEKLISNFPGILTLPNILTEVSNLTDGISENYIINFVKEIERFNETSIPSSEISKEQIFLKLGLTDSGISILAKSNHLVVTADLPLANFLETSKLPVINFNHIRF
ncbi:PIN domain-containing protein [Paenibacillus enshidis]|uniref:PIN domain-containing protein n=1 Tax=Paenibacillus enshidis TaxID=1458439 RepID=A0ABV5AZV7_9BACL